jgi:hypothetical protein
VQTLQPRHPGRPVPDLRAGVPQPRGRDLERRAGRRGGHGPTSPPRRSRSFPGQDGTRILIKGGVVMSVDPDVGNFAKGDVLIEGSKIMEVGHHIDAADAHVIDASARS